MRTHQRIDERSLALARAIVAKIDNDPERAGLRRARENGARWFRENPMPALAEWQAILQRDWDEVRQVLLDPSEDGRRLRQSNPFCGVLEPRERWDIYRRFADE
ncbi:MAG: hypothetical protein HY706_00675 [Candidatus Hydrogenedentes bacterium]|nr:hypothetical protein [Candidatus Hydrogenedentota bacterium]